MQTPMGLEQIALAICNGGTQTIQCPHMGPAKDIEVMGDQLISCRALHNYRTNGDGRECLYLHREADGCPFTKKGGVIVKGEGLWPGHQDQSVA